MGEQAERFPLGVTAVMLPELDFDEQIELCRRLGIRYYVYRPRYIADELRDKPYHSHGNHRFDLTPERLRDEGPELAGKLREAGMEPYCSVPRATAADSEESLALHVAGAAAGGARSLRLLPPPYPNEVFDYELYLSDAVEHFRRAVAMARDAGLKIVIEMHAATAAASPGLAYNLVREFDPADLGVILDLPNFAREGNLVPHLGVSVVSPWVDHCHWGGLKRTEGSYDQWGFRHSERLMCTLEESDIPLPDWLRALEALDRDELPLVIEDYRPNMPGRVRLETTAASTQRLIAGVLDEAGAGAAR